MEAQRSGSPFRRAVFRGSRSLPKDHRSSSPGTRLHQQRQEALPVSTCDLRPRASLRREPCGLAGGARVADEARAAQGAAATPHRVDVLRSPPHAVADGQRDHRATTIGKTTPRGRDGAVGCVHSDPCRATASMRPRGPAPRGRAKARATPACFECQVPGSRRPVVRGALLTSRWGARMVPAPAACANETTAVTTTMTRPRLSTSRRKGVKEDRCSYWSWCDE